MHAMWEERSEYINRLSPLWVWSRYTMIVVMSAVSPILTSHMIEIKLQNLHIGDSLMNFLRKFLRLRLRF